MKSRVLVFLAAAAVTCLFFINLCNALFDCGCTYLWAGAAAHCNIHDPGGRHCPWCAAGNAGFAGVFLTIIGAQALISFGPWSWNWAVRLTLALLSFPLMGAVLAGIMGHIQGYWA